MNRQNLVLIGVLAFLMALPIVSCEKKNIVAGPSDPVTISKVVKKKAEMAAVKMSHDKHSLSGVKCVECHHKNSNDDRIKICSKCKDHRGEDGKEILHSLCIDCHKKEKAGPTGCDACHK